MNNERVPSYSGFPEENPDDMDGVDYAEMVDKNDMRDKLDKGPRVAEGVKVGKDPAIEAQTVEFLEGAEGGKGGTERKIAGAAIGSMNPNAENVANEGGEVALAGAEEEEGAE